MMLKLVDIVISYSDSHFKEWYIILYQFQLVPNTFALSNNCMNKLVRFIPCHNELMFSPIFTPFSFIHFIHNLGAKQFNLTGCHFCVKLQSKRSANVPEYSKWNTNWIKLYFCYSINWIVFLYSINQIVIGIFKVTRTWVSYTIYNTHTNHCSIKLIKDDYAYNHLLSLK